MRLLLTIFLSIISFMAGAQNMAINNTGANAHPKAILDLQSTDKGFLVPRMTEIQRTAMFPVADVTARGTLVYQTDNVDGYYYYDGAAWKYIFTSGAGWSLTGNSGTNAASNFMGTTDNQPLIFKTNNAERLRVTETGNIGIANTSPVQKLDVTGNINIVADSNYRIGDIRILSVKGSSNLFAGKFAGINNTTGNRNTFIGDSSGYANTTGAANVGVGDNTFRNLTNGTWNVAVGTRALQSLTNGFSNSAVGISSLYSTTSGYRNSALGGGSLEQNITGAMNTAVGYYSIKSATNSNYNTAVGTYSMMNSTSGDNNVAIGFFAGASNNASNNVLIGYYAGTANTTGTNNAIIGMQAGYNNTTGTNNSFLGMQAGFNNTTGTNNSFLGLQAGFSNVDGNYNSFMGMVSGFNNTSGHRNTFIGAVAGYYNTTGAWNTFIGVDAGKSNTTGNFNTFSGFQSGILNTTGNQNSFYGRDAGLNNSTGNQNVFIGESSGIANTTGSNNVFLGYNAGNLNNAGNYNVGIGNNAQVANGLINATAIGANSSVTANNSLVLGGTGANAVNVGIGTTSPGNKLFVTNGSSGIASAHPLALIATESNISNYINLLSPLETGVLFGTGANHTDGGIIYNNVANLNGLHFRTNGNNTRMVIDQNGRVGIGTITPNAMLQLSGNSFINYPQISLTESEAADYSRLTFDNPASTKYWTIAAHADNTDANALLNIYNSSTGDLLSVRGNGYVGIGTSAPSTKLNVMGSETNMPVRIQNQLNSGYAGIHLANAAGTTQGHIGYGNPGAGTFTNQIFMGSATAIPVVITTSDVERVRVDATGNVGIGTNNPTTDLEVNGFTKLGSNAPAIKTLKLTGTTAGTQGGTVSVAHGLTTSKILSVDVLVEYNTNLFVHHSYSTTAGYDFSFWINSSINVMNASGNSANILGKPFKIFITYEE